jgi:hypothetical protein
MTEPFGVSHWNEITMFKQRPDGVQVIRWKNLVFRIGPKNLPKHRSREPAVYLRRNKLSQQTTNRSKQKQGTSGFLPPPTHPKAYGVCLLKPVSVSFAQQRMGFAPVVQGLRAYISSG